MTINIADLSISIAENQELSEFGDLMASVYSQLDGFPSKEEQPSYYDQFSNLGDLTISNSVDVLVAKGQDSIIVGGVVYNSDMKSYGAGGKATTSITHSAGIRLLAVSAKSRDNGIGRNLTEHCIELAKQSDKKRLILHTTQYMPEAWKLYESMEFTRYKEIDFMQGALEVFGFQLPLIP